MSDNEAKWPGSERILHQLMEMARISALAEMASGFAHELNQPLAAIAAFSQAGERMLDRPDPLVGRALQVFGYINHEALSAGEDIQRVRRLFERGVPVLCRCQMPDVIEEIRPALNILALSVGCDLRVTADGGLPDLLIDRLRIQHVLFALTQNAAHASAHVASATIKIDVCADRYAVRTSIVDSGSGVSDHARDQLFRPFFTTKPQGTGLGLASSRAIVEAHEGTMGFDNLAGGGSCFWFKLPAAARESEQE